MQKNISKLSIEITPYQFEPEKSDVETPNGTKTENKQECVKQTEVQINKIDWCKCGQCHEEEREIDCLCWHDIATPEG